MTLRRSCVRIARLIALFVAVLGVASVATAQSPQSKSVFRDARRLDAAADKKPIEPKIIIAPRIMQRLQEEDSQILAQIQKDFDTPLKFASDPARHPESFAIIDAATSQVLYSQT